jgi:hypothetical protein
MSKTQSFRIRAIAFLKIAHDEHQLKRNKPAFFLYLTQMTLGIRRAPGKKMKRTYAIRCAAAMALWLFTGKVKHLGSLVNRNRLAPTGFMGNLSVNFDDNRSAQDRAWAVASDPSASEKNWMAACTLLEGRRHVSVRDGRKLPMAVGLPWSLAISGLSALGAFMIFGVMSAGVCEVATNITGVFHTCSIPQAFALLSAAFIAFSAIFTYQQHIWGGGRAWTFLHYGLVGIGACLPLMELLFAYPTSVGNLCLFTWSLGFIGVSTVAVKLTRNSIKALESTVGANRVMPYSRAMFASAGALLLTFCAFPGMFWLVGSMSGWLPAMLICSGFYIARSNSAHNPQTAATLAFAAWNPVILANAILLPALIAYSALTLVLPLAPVSLADYGIGLITMLCFSLGPFIGAQIGSFMQQRDRALELHRTPVELLANTAMPIYRLDSEETLCESP